VKDEVTLYQNQNPKNNNINPTPSPHPPNSPLRVIWE